MRSGDGGYAGWEPVVMRNATVEPEELEGYEIWREAEDERSSGVWGRDEREGFMARITRMFRRD